MQLRAWPGAESSSFSQQQGRFLDNLGRSSTCSSLLAVECTAMVFNALEINSYVFREEIGANAKNGSVDERSTHWHLRNAKSASIASLAIQWKRPGADMQRLACAVPELQHERGGAYPWTKAFQASRLSPNVHLSPNKTTTYGSVYRADRRYLPAKSVNGDASGRPSQRIVCRRIKRHAETDTV